MRKYVRLLVGRIELDAKRQSRGNAAAQSRASELTDRQIAESLDIFKGLIPGKFAWDFF
jgi:hypothetical protein